MVGCNDEITVFNTYNISWKMSMSSFPRPVKCELRKD